jgi:hypothetical protein
MKIDISRNSFRRERHYREVRSLQGRVQLDADLNEQADIIGYLRETMSRDVVGHSGGPIGEPGFEISDHDDDLSIGRGRYYLDGILVENDADISFRDQIGARRFPDLFSDPAKEPDKPTSFVAYLDVWQHAVTVLDDPAMREVALPCPDTSVRTKTAWQVKLKVLDEPFLEERGVVIRSKGCPGGEIALCDARILEKIVTAGTSTGRMNARVSPDTEAPEPCTVVSRRGYRRLENQLYRVEIHKGGGPGEATFKWSRENGSVAVLWDTSDTAARLEKNADLLVKNPGGSAVTGFAPGDWIEVTDGERELCRVPGYFARLSRVDGTKFTVDRVRDPDDNEAVVSIDAFSSPIIRRWDSCSPKKVELSTAETEWTPLEDGVEVQFFKDPDGGEHFQTGDYWLIPARTANGEITWHPEESDTRASSRYYHKPDGPRHHFGLLAICRWSGTKWEVFDCRRFFRSLVQEPAIHITEIGLQDRKRQEADPSDTLNDSVVTLDEFKKGFRICFDRPIEKAALKLPIVSVIADLPTQYGSQPTTLDGTIDLSKDGRVMLWTPGDASLDLLARVTKEFEKSALIQVSVKGNLVWGTVNDSPVYLDGVAFGTVDRRNPQRITLSLPSGDSNTNSDFRMWFSVGTVKKCGLETVPKGGTVFIGEQDLDISECVASGARIGWFKKYQPDREPDDEQVVPDAGKFNVSPDIFAGKTENWYSNWGDDNPTVAFVVKDPSLDIKIWDNGYNKDVTGKSVEFGTFLNFRIDSNLAPIADRCGGRDLPKGYLRIRVKSVDGTLYSELRQSETELLGLTGLVVRSTLWFWVEASASRGWATGLLTADHAPFYEPGSYTVSAELALNRIKDTYKGPDGSDYIGKTVTSVKTITIVPKRVTIEANRDSILKGDEVTFSGSNAAEGEVFLYVSDAADPTRRFNLSASSGQPVSGRKTTFSKATVRADGTWAMTWDTSKIKESLSPGNYLIHVVTKPGLAGELGESEHAVIPVEIREA